MLALRLSRQAGRFLQELQPKQARQIAEKLKALVESPSDVGGEQLKGYAPMMRLKAGEYRIIYVVEADAVEVRLIGKRNDDDIYRALDRLKKR